MTDIPTPLKAHPAAEIFPLMSEGEFAAFVEDIRECGLIEPIVLHESMILDGRNRYRACQQLGIQPPTVEWDGSGSPQAFVVSKNLHRRHLNERQRALIAARIANITRGDVGGGRTKTDRQMSEPEAAMLLNVSRTMVTAAKTLLREGTADEIGAVEVGKASITTTVRAIRKRKKKEAPPEVDAVTKAASHRARISVPEGKTVEDVCREGLRLEADGATTEDAVKALTIGVQAYRKIRDIIFLIDHPNLVERDRERAVKALQMINETKQVEQAYEAVLPLADRMWGSKRGNTSRTKAEKRHAEAFERAYGIIVQVCIDTDHVEVPYFNKDRAADVIAELKRAESGVKRLRRRIEEIYQ